MKKILLPLLFFFPLEIVAQFTDNFSDGDFTQNPAWTGTTENFTVNTALQLQSNAVAVSTSYLSTPSEAIDDAVWEFWVQINQNPSSSNYSAVYVVADNENLTVCNGYFLKIGGETGTADKITLYLQQGTKTTSLIAGRDTILTNSILELKIKLTRDSEGNFTLYTRKPNENEFILEGVAQNTAITQSRYFGVWYKNTATAGKNFLFDDIVVTGEKSVDITAPILTNFEMRLPNQIFMQFSEEMNFSNAVFDVDNGIETPQNLSISSDKTSVVLIFDSDFERGTLYTIYFTGLTDVAGNALEESERKFGIVEMPEVGDVTWNEAMFDAPTGGLEYLEIANLTDKLLDASKLCFATRSATTGKLGAARRIPAGTYLFPHDYLAFCSNADSLRNYYYNLPAESRIVTTVWTSLNNESATLALFTAENRDTIVLEEFTYNAKWHHALIKNKKGVALEKINPDLPANSAESWHSAASEVSYGTPGYRNSQYREITKNAETENFVWTEPPAFSPDNDGFEDVCFVHYNMAESGFVANITIFTATGIKIKQLAANYLLQPEGFITWDGATDNGKLANAGIYVILFEAINPNNGA
ncbi:MAG: Ig-like domain-containing protein, partial [Paludibacter sp.]|nr:Ig-like domain-containing protein [Paludibacter sp.]